MDTYKLFIVDDEISSRSGIRECFDWLKYGIEVVGEADNGINALKLISEVKPDIVITDVRMPKMDGIQLSAELNRLYKNMKIIFISGYNDFEYLKSALKLDAVDYVLKPVNLKEMHDVIRKVVNMIEDDKSQQNKIYQMNAKLLQSMPLLREKFLISLIRDGISDGNNLKERLEFLGLNLDISGRYCVLVLSVDDRMSVFGSISERDKELTSFSVINICQELIDIYNRGYVFENRLGEYVCILRFELDEDVDKLFILTKEIKDNLAKYLKINLTIGLGKTVDHLKKLPQSYKTAYEAASQKLFLGKNNIITMDSIGTYKDILPMLDMDKWQKVYSALKTANEENAEEFINELFAELSKSRNIDVRYCHTICIQLLIIASSLLTDLEVPQEGKAVDIKDTCELVFELETIDEMKNYILSYFKKVCRMVGEKRNKRSANVVEKVKDIIYSKYHTNLTIGDIAQEVFLASTYLCLVFKQETGETLNEFITKVRVEKAKELLGDKNNKLYDIGYAVGYTDASYFTKIFKKHTGMTPSEFRERTVSH